MISDHPERFEITSAAKFYHLHYHIVGHIFRSVLYNGSIVFEQCFCIKYRIKVFLQNFTMFNNHKNIFKSELSQVYTRVSVDILISKSDHIFVGCNNAVEKG